ncbi:hypothetical protein D3C73_1530920 [compost metagenome]
MMVYQRMLQYLIHMGYRYELHIAAHALRNILEIALVVLRKKDFFVAGPVGSQ